MGPTFWTDLVAVILLVLLGFGGGKLAERFGLPAVTAFLLVGIAFGPFGLRLISVDQLAQIGFVEPLALGLIVFLVGEELTPRALLSRHWSFWLTSALAVGLPLVLVGVGIYLLRPDPTLAVLLAIIAVSGAPATVMAILHEVQKRGRACDTLLGTAALDNVVTVVLYAIAVPVLLYGGGSRLVTGALPLIARDIGVAMVVGVVVGYGVARLLERIADEGQMLVMGLMAVALLVALDEVLHSSVILACLSAGIVVAIMEERRGVKGRLFRIMSTVKYGVYIVFFTVAGAALQPGLALSAGLVAVAYMVLRSVGRIGAGIIGGRAAGYGTRDATLLGLGLLPQAGVAVGLAIDAGETFPVAGPVVNAVVLASIVVFELVGPLAVRRAVSELGEEPETEEESALVCVERTVAIAIGPDVDAAAALQALEALGPIGEGCSYRVELLHVAGGKGVGGDAPLSGASGRLASIGSALAEQGHVVNVRTLRGASVESALAESLATSDATTLLMPVDASRPRWFGAGALRRRRHRIADAAGKPVLLVPVEH